MSKRYKYPRTFHLPWSPGKSDDDKVMLSTQVFVGKQVVITEKMDGENTTIYSDGYLHARSTSYSPHPSRDWVKGYASAIDLPKGVRVCGENMFAKHSIFYNNLGSYFLGFSAWEGDTCLSWQSTMELFDSLGIITVPVIYQGVYNEPVIKKLEIKDREGYVVRLQEEFNLDEFQSSVGKYVRANHVQSSEHWMHQELIKNELEKYDR